MSDADSTAGFQQIKSLTSRASRQQLWERTAVCPKCGGRVSLGDSEACPLCNDTGLVTWDGKSWSLHELRLRVVDQAQHDAESGDGYLWIACHFPDLAQDPDVQRMIRAEAARHPTWALWGYAPDMLVKAGMGDVVDGAARKMPDAASVSLRAKAALQGDKR